jgi:glutamate synthase (NADPH/NADH) small chain
LVHWRTTAAEITLVSALAVESRGNVRANTADYQTSLAKVFSAGDMRRGQSLVVWAIREGRLCARAIDQFLMGTTNLPR